MRVKFKEILRPALALVIICFIITLFISATNYFTKDIIEQREVQDQIDSRKMVLKEALEFKEYGKIENCYVGYDGDKNIVGYTFITESKGYGGTLVVMTGITIDNKVEGIEILSQSETPGLGTNAENPEFKDKYKQEVPEDRFKIVKGEAKNSGEIEAMTGATISSRAVTNAVNDALDRYKHITQDGGSNQ